VDDAKIIDLICTRSKTRKTNNVAQRRRTNQRRTKTTKSQ